jgi:SAM-dependent methyltransferase
MSSFKQRTRCGLCRGGELELCVRLPATPLANEYLKERGAQEIFPLDLIMCVACCHVQTSIVVSPERLFSDYLYETSTSPQTIAHLDSEAHAIHYLAVTADKPYRLLEIGSNDGAFGKEMIKLIGKDRFLGVEPSKTMSKKAVASGVPTVQAFFGPGIEKLAPGKWDVIVANNVFAHVPSVRDMLETVASLLTPNGILVMEVNHASDIIRGAFDVIYHEHTAYHTLAPLRRALEDVRIPMFDVEVMSNQVGRGSLRVWAGRGRSPSKRMLDAMLAEEDLRLDDPITWTRKLGKGKNSHVTIAAKRLKTYFDNWKLRTDSPLLCGYGAPAKLTTLTYACDVQDVRAIAEDSPWKIGRLTPGRQISIVSRRDLLRLDPDAVIVFAWNFADRIGKSLREDGYEGEIYVPMPEGRLIP